MPPTKKQECAGLVALREKFPKKVRFSAHWAGCHKAPRILFEGRKYCLAHAPVTRKAESFEKVINEKLAAGDYNFRGYWFPGNVDFRNTKFPNAVYFDAAVFNGAALFDFAEFPKNVSFAQARFESIASFMYTKYLGRSISYHQTQFNGGRVNFHSTHFKSVLADFSEAKFAVNAHFRRTFFSGEVTFSDAVFEKHALFDRTVFRENLFLDFGQARFADFTRFMEIKMIPGAEVCFGEAIFGNPQLVLFHSLNLSPRWFINVDPSKFIFENVKFHIPPNVAGTIEELNKTEDFKQKSDKHRAFRTAGENKLRMLSLLGNLEKLKAPPAAEQETPQEEEETEAAEDENAQDTEAKKPEEATVSVEKFDKLLMAAYWRLGDNSEANKRFREAAGFRYMAMECQRLSEKKGWAFWTLHWWYWFSSGYGEKSLRALAVLIIIWLVFAGLYLLPAPFSGFYGVERLGIDEAFKYSFGVMSLQKPDPKPLGGLTYFLVSLETALGPVQAALLALAIRRKFMR